MEKYGPVFVWYLGPKPVVVLSDPEDWHALLSGSNTSPLPKWAKLYAVSESVRTWAILELLYASTSPLHKYAKLCTVSVSKLVLLGC